MRVILCTVLACALLSICANPATAQSPSFDCGKARLPDEIAICQTPELAELDIVVAAAYAYLKTTRGRAYADQIGIPTWRLRQACQSEASCIRQRQIEAIRAYQAAGAPVSIPVWVGPEQGAAPPPAAEPAPERPPAYSETKSPHPSPSDAISSGTGFYITHDGYILTNAHVVHACSEIRLETKPSTFTPATLSAKDTTNDLALLKIEAISDKIAGFRFTARLGEGVEAFGYPLAGILATSGNFSVGNITALSGLGDDSRYLQISVPVQPGNSGGPLLDQQGNLVGIVSAKLNALEIMAYTKGDIPQNVNFAIRASVAANFLQTNNIKFELGEGTQAMQPADLAEQAKAISVHLECLPASVPNPAPPAPSQSPPSASASVPSMPVRWYEGMDAWGNDFGAWLLNVPNADDCMRQCVPDSACVGVTYNIRRSVCIRKGRITNLIHARDAAITGVLTDRTPAPDTTAGATPHVRHYENIDAPGNDRGSWIRGVSSADCESICIADSGCAGYTYNRLRATCIPKSVVVRLMSSSEPAMTGVVEGR